MQLMKANTGDLLYVTDHRWWMGGLHSTHAKAGDPITEVEDFDKVYLSKVLMDRGRFKEGTKVSVEKIF